jgi:hypothetical protein
MLRKANIAKKRAPSESSQEENRRKHHLTIDGITGAAGANLALQSLAALATTADATSAPLSRLPKVLREVLDPILSSGR